MNHLRLIIYKPLHSSFNDLGVNTNGTVSTATSLFILTRRLGTQFRLLLCKPPTIV